MTIHSSQFCQQCHYDLLGSPQQGHCPECGNPYDKTIRQGVVSEAAERLRRGDQWVAKLRTIGLVVAGVLVMICGGLLSWIAVHPTKPLAVGGAISGMLLVGAVVSYLSQREGGDEGE